MMRQIISSSEDSITTMIERVKTMKLGKFDGEDVSKATGQMRMAIKRLTILNKVPVEIKRNVLEVLQTSTVPKFNLFFSQLQINLKQLVNLDIDVEDILSMADTQYKELLELGHWTSAKHNKATDAFVANGENDNDKICGRCGKKHPGQSCSLPHWKVIPPKDGVDEKLVKNRKWFWCSRCNRWNTTHTTTQHKSKTKPPEDNPSENEPPTTPGILKDASSLKAETEVSSPAANFVQYDLSSLQSARRTAFKNCFIAKTRE